MPNQEAGVLNQHDRCDSGTDLNHRFPRRRRCVAWKLALSVALVLGNLLAALPALAADDYPYRSSPANQVDPWGFYTRQCTSFVAWRLNAANGVSFSNQMVGPNGKKGRWGNAYNWDDNARLIGYRVDTIPAVGAVAQWNAGEGMGAYGHVAWVAAVNSDGSVVIEDYNRASKYGYGTTTIRAPRYIHIKDLSPPASPPPPVVNSITPASVEASSFDLTINGSGFVCPAVDQIYWAADGRFVGQGQVLTCSATKLVVREEMTGASAGSYLVKVKNADGRLSNAVSLTVTAPVTNLPPEAHLSMFVAGRESETMTYDNGTLYWSLQPSATTTTIVFNGGRSFDPDGGIASYEWRINGTLVSTQWECAFDLGRGTHQVLLTVRDNSGVSRSVGATIILS